MYLSEMHCELNLVDYAVSTITTIRAVQTMENTRHV